MSKIRLMPWILGCLFATWWIYVYLFLDREWFPIFFHHPLYPLSILIEYSVAHLIDWIAPATDRGWTRLGYFTGLIYFVCGFSWYFLIGLVIRRAARYLLQAR